MAHKQPEVGEESPAFINARAPEQDAAPTVPVAPVAPGMVLAKNFGLVFHGQSHWWPAGTPFNPATHAELISRMVAAGAAFK